MSRLNADRIRHMFCARHGHEWLEHDQPNDTERGYCAGIFGLPCCDKGKCIGVYTKS